MSSFLRLLIDSQSSPCATARTSSSDIQWETCSKPLVKGCANVNESTYSSFMTNCRIRDSTVPDLQMDLHSTTSRDGSELRMRTILFVGLRFLSTRSLA